MPAKVGTASPDAPNSAVEGASADTEAAAAAAEFTGTDEENAAAAKIQAGFKGKKVRDEMKAKKTEGETAEVGDGDVTAAGPAAEPAAEPGPAE